MKKPIRLWLGIVILIGISLFVYAQVTGSNFPLFRWAAGTMFNQGSIGGFDLGPGNLSAELPFDVSGGAAFALDMLYEGDARLTLIDPQGREITPENAGQFGAEFRTVTIPTDVRDLAFAIPGNHIYVTVNNPTLGRWIARVQTVSVAKGTVTTQTFGGDAFAAGVVVDSPDNFSDVILLNSSARMAAFLFKANQPQTAASVSATVRRISSPTQTYSITPVLDSSNVAYTASLPTDMEGSYTVTVTFLDHNGIALGKASTVYTVVAGAGRIGGSIRDLGPTDTNGDGLFDYFAIGVPIVADRAGRFETVVYLKGSNDRQLQVTDRSDLPVGSSEVRLKVFAEDLRRQIGVDGPYLISIVAVSFLPMDGTVDIPVGLLENIGQTQAYRLSQFHRPAIAVAGYVGDRGVDTNANGRFDQLIVEFKIDVVQGGHYTWTGDLRDAEGNLIVGSKNQGSLASGENTVQLVFNGEPLGRYGKDGPYRFGNMTIYPTYGGSGILTDEVGQTRAYRCSQFEGCGPLITNIDQLIAYVNQMTLVGGVNKTAALRNSLLKKLEAAKAQILRDNSQPARGQLGAFKNEVAAQTNKAIPADEADLVTKGADYVISTLP